MAGLMPPLVRTAYRSTSTIHRHVQQPCRQENGSLVRAEALRRVGDLPVAEEGGMKIVAATLVWPLDGPDAHLVRGARWTVHRDAGVLDVPVGAADNCTA